MIASPAIVAHFSIRRLIWPRKFSISALCSIRYQSSFAGFELEGAQELKSRTSRPAASEPRFANRSAVASFEPKPMPDHDAWSAPHQHRKSLA
ncbi:hypothetical protein ACOSQ3_025074 [Xanthoceras sorbifolium]